MRSSTISIRRVAAIAAAGLGVIAGFQAALAFGAPLGRAAWGGAQPTLPPELRVASGVAAMVWTLAALVVLGRVGHWGSPRWDATFRLGTWAIAGLLGLGAIVNVASSSPWERYGWGPFALVLAVACLQLARTPRASAA